MEAAHLIAFSFTAVLILSRGRMALPAVPEKPNGFRAASRTIRLVRLEHRRRRWLS